MSLINTLMQPLISEYSEALDKNERRQSIYGVWDLFQRQTNSPQSILDDEVKANIKRSFGNVVKVPVIDYQDVTIGNTRSCVVPISENVSDLVQLTFETYAFGFTMQPAHHYNNFVKYQQDFNVKMRKYLLKLAALLDERAYQQLNTDRNQFWDGIVPPFSQENNALIATNDRTQFWYNQLSSVMNMMDFYGQFDVIGSTYHRTTVNEWINQGGGNAINSSFQFNEFEFGYSNRVTVDPASATYGDFLSTAFCMPKGTVAVENRNDPDAIAGYTAGDGTEWGETFLPLVNLNVGFKYDSKCQDIATELGTTDVSGLTASMREGFQFSTDICFVTAYNSDPENRYSPIVKYNFGLSD